MSSFISAYELVETNTVLNTSNEYEDINRTEDNIQQYIKKSKIQNTEACTQKWVVNGKCIELQDQEYGKTDKSKELTKKEICQILLYLNSDGNLIFIIRHEKNNQGGLQGQNEYGKFSSQHIHIPADLPNNEFKSIQDLQKRRMTIQLLSDLSINEHKMITFSGHQSVNGLRSYKVPNNEQQLKNTRILINAIQESEVLISTQEEFQIPVQVPTHEETQVLIQEDPQDPTQKKHKSQYKMNLKLQCNIKIP
ncbi:22779_t:CDS:2, partial [Cetraspora pellucida]